MEPTIRNALTNYIGRWVTAAFTVIVAPLLPAAINLANNIVGYDLTDAQVNAYAQKAAFAVAAVVVAWLINRGAFERKVIDTEPEPDFEMAEGWADEEPGPDPVVKP